MIGESLSWFSLPSPATDEQIAAVERVVQKRFPDDFREFVKRFSGGAPNETDFEFSDGRDGTFFASAGQFLTFIPDDRNYVLACVNRTEFFPADLLPFAVDGGGNLTCLDFRFSESPSVVFWHCGRRGLTDEISPVARDFTEFIGLLHLPVDDDLA
jgi:hypothetical protein